MEVYDVIQKWRTVRQYRADKTPEDILNKLLSAMRVDPSGGKRQPYKHHSNGIVTLLKTKSREYRAKRSIHRFYPRNCGNKDLWLGFELAPRADTGRAKNGRYR